MAKEQTGGSQVRNDAIEKANQASQPGGGGDGIDPRVQQAHHEIRPSASPAQRTRGQAPKRNLMPADPCPLVPAHKNTVVYTTKGRTRHCKCNDCGHTWKQAGPFAEPWRECMMKLAEMLAQVERQDAGGERVIVLRASDVDAICQELTLYVEAG